MKKILFASAFLALSIYGFAQTKSQYKIANKFHVDGDLGWDYIACDDSANRLYVSHGTMVQVLDLNNGGKVIGTIAGLNGVHGIAVASDLNKGFITSGKDSVVAVLDLTTFATIAKVKVTGAGPDAILYDKFTHKVFTFNGHSNNSTVIDAKTNAVIGTIDLPGKPEFAVADGNGKVYDNLEDKNMICVINATTMKVETTWSIAPGDGPSGLAIDTKNHRLFSVCDKLMVIVNADNGKIVTTLPIGDRVDATAFDVSLNRVYSSNGDATLTVVQEDGPDKFTVLENVATAKGARTCALNSKTHHVYLPSAEYGAPPAPTADKPKPKPPIKPNSFQILDVEYVK
ncbi:MAG TPA: YncE family protein [Bacteroidia bacterium]|jgi:YVTN family beta-propeller protein|nr:YncE family protein [Bacteroidia bacterium]